MHVWRHHSIPRPGVHLGDMNKSFPGGRRGIPQPLDPLLLFFSSGTPRSFSFLVSFWAAGSPELKGTLLFRKKGMDEVNEWPSSCLVPFLTTESFFEDQGGTYTV